MVSVLSQWMQNTQFRTYFLLPCDLSGSHLFLGIRTLLCGLDLDHIISLCVAEHKCEKEKNRTLSLLATLQIEYQKIGKEVRTVKGTVSHAILSCLLMTA